MPEPSSSLAAAPSADEGPEPRQRFSEVLSDLAVILFLPIPFGNIPPAFAIAAFALGILERDGLATIIGWLAMVGSVLILAAISSAIIAGIRAFLDQLWVLIG